MSSEKFTLVTERIVIKNKRLDIFYQVMLGFIALSIFVLAFVSMPFTTIIMPGLGQYDEPLVDFYEGLIYIFILVVILIVISNTGDKNRCLETVKIEIVDRSISFLGDFGHFESSLDKIKLLQINEDGALFFSWGYGKAYYLQCVGPLKDELSQLNEMAKDLCEVEFVKSDSKSAIE